MQGFRDGVLPVSSAAMQTIPQRTTCRLSAYLDAPSTAGACSDDKPIRHHIIFNNNRITISDLYQGCLNYFVYTAEQNF
jgi:hypothetical protein